MDAHRFDEPRLGDCEHGITNCRKCANRVYTAAEMTAVLARVGVLAVLHDRDNPNVGMGPSPAAVLSKEVSRLPFSIPGSLLINARVLMEYCLRQPAS